MEVRNNNGNAESRARSKKNDDDLQVNSYGNSCSNNNNGSTINNEDTLADSAATQKHHSRQQRRQQRREEVEAVLQAIPVFKHDSVLIQKLLGTGAFSEVYSISLKNNEQIQQGREDCSEEDEEYKHITVNLTPAEKKTFLTLIKQGENSTRTLETEAEDQSSLSQISAPRSLSSLSSSSIYDHEDVSNSITYCLEPTITQSLPQLVLKRVAFDDHSSFFLSSNSNMHDSPQHQAASRRELCKEAVILAQLQRAKIHPHICQLFGITNNFDWSLCPDNKNSSSSSIVGDSSGGGGLILEKLHETLHQALGRWKENPVGTGGQQPSSLWQKLRPRGKSDAALQQQMAATRLEVVAVGAAKALEFLHEHSVIYRDLKPENIGFATNGTVKLFDFSTARQIPKPMRHTSCGRSNTEDTIIASYRRCNNKPLSARVGTLRYMSPECATSEHYSLPTDVYSWGLVVYETATLQKPYDDITDKKELERLVTNVNKHPPLHQRSIPSGLAKLLQAVWGKDPRSRPTMADARRELEQVLHETMNHMAQPQQSSIDMRALFFPTAASQ